MSIQIQPIDVGYPLQTATVITIIMGNFELSTATTSQVNTYVSSSNGDVIASSTLQLPTEIFMAFINNQDSSGSTIVEDYVLSVNGFSRV